MGSRNYYNEKSARRRTLQEGDGVRNAHNFIKAVLIQTHIPKGIHLLDLGCGQGGDILKYRRLNLKSYRGIDTSHTAIDAASVRILKSNFHCRIKLECIDFTRRSWAYPATVDAISCQFAIHYAFETPEIARFVIQEVTQCLKPSGVFIGTMPVHSDKVNPYTSAVVVLPGDGGECREPVATPDELTVVCNEGGLDCVCITPFMQFYEEAARTHPELQNIMRAHLLPQSNNVVFVFQKRVVNENESER